jgi:threonine dehydrogenase-like Zn-dependent dehydrogenase
VVGSWGSIRLEVVGNAPPVLELNGVTLQRGERSLIGVLMYNPLDFRSAMALLTDGVFADTPADEISEAFSLDAVADAFAALESGALQSLKAVIQPWHSA